MDQVTATDILALYQLCSVRRTGLPAELNRDDAARQLERILNDPSISPEEAAQYRDVLAGIHKEADVVRQMADRLVDSLPATVADKVKNIPVGTLPDLELNAQTLLTPNNEPIVVVASGLGTLLFELATYCAGATNMEGAPAELSLKAVTEGIFRWMMFYHTHSVEWVPESFQSRYANRRSLIGALWTNAFNFVLGHEYGHVMLGHLTDPAATVHSLSSDINGGPVILSHSHTLEFDADLAGTDAAFAYAETTHKGWYTITAAGLELALQVLRLQEEMFPRVGPSSHPPAAERLNAIHRIIAARYGQDIADSPADLATYFEITEKLARTIIPRIGS